MTSRSDVLVPRVNANEDQARVVQVSVVNGQQVVPGDLLFTIETTKSTVDVEAEMAGTIHGFSVAVDDVVAVGQVVCTIEAPDVKGTARTSSGNESSVTTRVTARARKRAAQLGVDVSALEAGGLIDEAAVEAFFWQQRKDIQAIGSGGASAFDWSRYRAQLAGRSAIVFGGGGHAAVVMDALTRLDVRVLGAVDDVRNAGDEVLPGRTVLGGRDCLQSYAETRDDGLPCLAFIGVGGTTDNRPRGEVLELLRSRGFELPPLVHPSAVVGEGTVIGEGAAVLAGVVIGTRCSIGPGAIINQGAQLCHDTRVGALVHLAPGALVAGWCTIGTGSTIGMAATILDRTRIGEHCLIHNGADVTGHVSNGQDVARDGTRLARGQGS